MPSRPPFIANAKLVQSFRGEVRAPLPLHPKERALVILAGLHLCFLPWALGARLPWAQVTSLVFGLHALLLALLPRRYEGELAPQGAFTLHPWPRLLRFPVFWLGLLFFAYVACQALNPAFIRGSAGPYWWIAPLEYIPWLPSGVEAPFEHMNAWRMLSIWGGAWALGCALWIGLTRRIAAQTVLTTVVANGAFLALVGVLQEVTNAKEVLWSIEPVTSAFVATFLYENHGGSYFMFIATLAISMMAWHHTRSLRRLERSSPAPVYAFMALVIATLVFMSGSRAAMILLAGYFVAAGGVYLVWHLRAAHDATPPALKILVALGAVALLTATGWFVNLDKSVKQIRDLTSDLEQNVTVKTRVLARQATLDLFKASPATGWGAGGFRHVFPITQRNYPEIYVYGKQRLFWDHAHNDYVQALAELGVIGVIFPALMLLWVAVKFLRLGGLAKPAFLLFAAGILLPLAHSWLDFPLYNCAIFTTVATSAALLLRWMELEQER